MSSEPLTENALIVGVGLKQDDFAETKESLAEACDLAHAAGANVVGTVAQTLTQFHAATLLGKGKIAEIKNMIEEQEISLVIVDHKLSGVQSRNLESAWQVRVIDRSQLILDIFAQRAQSYEGKMQVELAQMLDQLPRMVGAWQGSLSRQGGGIGTRGPGEKALELDRRRIHERVRMIKKKLNEVSKSRSLHRARRRRQQIPSFALIGYTNSGKSTLLNKLTQSDVLSKDQVFATLDPTTRKVFLPNIDNAVITDTVGFIRKLPTKLIEAFKATLEESAEADILLHVIDLSSPFMGQHIATVEALIEEFEWQDKKVLYVFNKTDQADPDKMFQVTQHPRVFISAATGEGLDLLKTKMVELLSQLQHNVELYFPNSLEHKLYELGREAQILKREPGRRGTICSVSLTPSQLSRWSEFLVKED